MDAETSEYKAIVIGNPGPRNQDTDTVYITLNQVEFPTYFLLLPISTTGDCTDSRCNVWVGDISEE